MCVEYQWLHEDHCNHIASKLILCAAYHTCQSIGVVTNSRNGFCSGCTSITQQLELQNPEYVRSFRSTYFPLNLQTAQVPGAQYQPGIQGNQWDEVAITLSEAALQRYHREEIRTQSLHPTLLTGNDARRLVQGLIRLDQTPLDPGMNALTHRGRLERLASIVAAVPTPILRSVTITEFELLYALRANISTSIQVLNSLQGNPGLARLRAPLQTRYEQIQHEISHFSQRRRDPQAGAVDNGHADGVYQPQRMERLNRISLLLRAVPLDSLPAEDRRCVICTEEYGVSSSPNQGPEVPVRIPCQGQHVFGDTCLTVWLQTNSTCPICRQDFRQDL